MNYLERCPGIYCGREFLSDGNWTECGACPRGFRSNESSACVPCDDMPMFYDWLYLGFMALLALVLHWFCIDMVALRRNIPKEVIVIHLSALVEILLASVFTLLLTEPIGSFTMTSCKAKKLSDWYTLLHNPTPNYETALHCTQEAVYPLYTMVFVFYAFGVIVMLTLRPLLVKIFLPKQGKFSIYAALYFFPILALLHAVGGGLIYYSFPYIAIILSVLSNAAHFAFKMDQVKKQCETFQALLIATFTNFRTMLITFGHWLIQGYGIIAVATLRGINLHPAMLILVPLPALFYIVTVKFTDPQKIHTE